MKFETVYRRYSPAARRSLSRYGVPDRDVADATHDVFLIVHRKLSGFRGDSELGTWVTGICRRVAADYRRCARARYEVLDPLPGGGGVFDESADEALLACERSHALTAAVRALPVRQRDVVTWFGLEDRPMAQVAQALCVPVQTAYARLYAGFRELRETLAPCQ